MENKNVMPEMTVMAPTVKNVSNEVAPAERVVEAIPDTECGVYEETPMKDVNLDYQDESGK
jgi:hypothetical protein